MARLLLLIFFVLTFASCKQNIYSTELTKALELAGTNRIELEKVLDYYSQEESDSLKLKAEVLICNMDVHFSYKSRTWDIFQMELDSLFRRKTSPRTSNRVWRFYMINMLTD